MPLPKLIGTWNRELFQQVGERIMSRATAMKEILEKRIALQTSQVFRNQMLALFIKSVALLPLAFLVPCAIWMFPTNASGMAIIAVAAGCLAATLVIWNIGWQFTNVASSRTQRAQQLEDLLLYFLSVPEEDWPAKEMLQIVVTGRQPMFGPSLDYAATRTKEDDSKLE